MKFSTTIILTLILGLFLACSNNEKKPAATTPQPADNTAPSIAPPPNVNANTGTAAPAGGVQHYICPNSCAGSGGATAGTCPVCGTAYVHNAAYHNQGNDGGASPMIQQPQQQSPAQNAAGVYHYTCPSGCAGGSGTAGTCAQCGAALAHNQAYHQ